MLPVYDIVLLPNDEIDRLSVIASRQLATLGTRFTLKSGKLYPHLSLYMANFTPGQLQAAARKLSEIARVCPALPLKAEHFGQNEHGMVEIFYATTPEIIRLQETIVAQLNPLRTGLRQLDPVGRVIADYIKIAPPEARQHLQQFGYDEIGSFFKPHITLARLTDPSKQIDWQQLPALGSFTTAFSTLALCKMGEHGTCTDIIATFACK